ncbi:YchJ family protein [Glaciihabitans arcticus]|uniref:YchJ family protein n=1 Tax=Glaciihabitans arcticus TaxID=2668039 RepID=UPI0018757B9E|nr:YchJ family protein [Glaciihabitans arcticus]
MSEVASADRCPCLSGETFGECCEPFHLGTRAVPTAERLMRSRYSAYATGRADYVISTWHPTTVPSDLVLDDDTRWYRLDILAKESGGPFDTEGSVLFEAFWRRGDERGSQLEKSRFVREDGRWLYVDGL